MIKIFAIFFFMTSVCFCDISEKNEKIYREVWGFYKCMELKKSLDLCTEIINDSQISDIDKLHFLVSRSILTCDEKQRIEDLDKIQYLKNINIECFNEYAIYYY